MTQVCPVNASLPCPFERKFALCQEIVSGLEECSTAITPYFQCCPILRSPPETPVLASDGYVYDREALCQWMRQCVERRDPIYSPINRTILRTTVRPLTLQLAIEEEVERRGSGGRRVFSSKNLGPLSCLITLVPPQHPSSFANVRSGSARCSRWSSKAGSLIRMLLDWDGDDIIDWVCPIQIQEDQHIVTIATPAPVPSLLIIAQEVADWLSISEMEFANPTHILTAYFSKRRPPTTHAVPLTLETMLLRHRLRRRTRS